MISLAEVEAEVSASAALSLMAALIQKLVRKGIFSHAEAFELYEDIAKFKDEKAELQQDAIEAKAATLLRHLAEKLGE